MVVIWVFIVRHTHSEYRRRSGGMLLHSDSQMDPAQSCHSAAEPAQRTWVIRELTRLVACSWDSILPVKYFDLCRLGNGRLAPSEAIVKRGTTAGHTRLPARGALKSAHPLTS